MRATKLRSAWNSARRMFSSMKAAVSSTSKRLLTSYVSASTPRRENWSLCRSLRYSKWSRRSKRHPVCALAAKNSLNRLMLSFKRPP